MEIKDLLQVLPDERDRLMAFESKKLNELLLARIPEVKESIDEVISWQDGMETGSHLVFEDGLAKFVIAACENADLMRRVFDFAEELLKGDNEYASNVIYVSFIEPLAFNTDPRCFFPYLKPKTNEIMQEFLKQKLGF